MAITSLNVYTTPTCPYSKLVKEFFKEKHLPYEEINVVADATNAQQLAEKSGQMGVPVIVVPEGLATTGREEVVIGFDRSKLTKILGL